MVPRAYGLQHCSTPKVMSLLKMPRSTLLPSRVSPIGSEKVSLDVPVKLVHLTGLQVV